MAAECFGIYQGWGNTVKCKFFSFYFSDAKNMARDVQNTFYEIAAELGNMMHEQAVDYVKKLMTKGRYSSDVWS